MFNKLTITALSVLASAAAFSQDFAGFRTGNYAGVNGVFFNPASVADSRYRLDINIASVSGGLGNNQVYYKMKDLFSGTFSGDSLKNKIFGKDAGPSSASANFTVIGPSVMFNLNKTSAIAITTRARMIMNVRDMDGKLVDQVLNNPLDPAAFPYTISSAKNMQLNLNGWSEFGLSYAKVLNAGSAHVFKAGITVKYLAGVANSYLNLDHINTTLNLDQVNQTAYLNNSTGRVGMGFGGINISNFNSAQLTNFSSSGLGMDLGLIYEFKGSNEGHKIDSTGWTTHDEYKVKVGVSVLDLGSLRYTADPQRTGTYDVNITGNKRLNVTEIQNLGLDDYKQFFSSHPQFFTPVNAKSAAAYNVSLPTTLQVNVDYHIQSGFYINAAGQFSLVTTANKPYNSQYYNAFNFTARFESKRFGFYLPLNYNELTGLNAGVALRSGPFFIGSGSVLSAVFGHSRQADVHAGLRFSRLHHNKKERV